jgi:hypothetical protein
MFHHQAQAFQLRQWSGWKHFLNDFIRRESVRTAWQLSKGTYDTDVQRFTDGRIAALETPAPPPPIAKLPSPSPANPEPASQPVA